MKHTHTVLSMYQDEAYDVVYHIGTSFGQKGFGLEYYEQGVYFTLPNSSGLTQMIVTHEDFEKINAIFTEEPYASSFRRLREIPDGNDSPEYTDLVLKSVQEYFPPYPKS